MPLKATPVSIKSNPKVPNINRKTRYNRLNTVSHHDVSPYVEIIPAYETDSEEISRLSQTSSVSCADVRSINSDYGVSEDGHTLIIPDLQVDACDVVTRTYKRRFWILFIYSFLTWFCCVQWNAWGPISESMFVAFPDWSTATVAMMETWVTLVFVFSVLPVCWATGRIGLRSGILISSFLLAVGLALRCITDKSPLFTVMCHVCAVLLGLSMTLILSAPPMIASVWFSPNERTTAVAIIMGASQLGNVGSYLEPLLVRAPAGDIPPSLIKRDILNLMYSVAGIAAITFLLVLAYFPSRPPLPPSFTSQTERLDFTNGILSVIRSGKFITMVLLYGFASGPSLGWIGVLNFSLKPLGFNQDAAMFVGLSSVMACFVVTMITAWLTDRLYGHLKETIIFLLVAASLSYYWFLLLSEEVIPYSKWQIFSSVSLGLSLNFATIPLFFELAVELVYPVPEVLVGGLVTASDSLSTSIFLAVYFFRSIGFKWVSYVLVASNAIPAIVLIFIRADYTRANLDSPANVSEE